MDIEQLRTNLARSKKGLDGLVLSAPAQTEGYDENGNEIGIERNWK